MRWPQLPWTGIVTITKGVRPPTPERLATWMRWAAHVGEPHLRESGEPSRYWGGSLMVVPDRVDTAIVGGGLAGLTAAMVLAQAGQHVAVFEKSNEFGGRARSDRHHGFTFNLGPHALYLGGPGEQVLRKAGIEVRGGIPSTRGYVVAVPFDRLVRNLKLPDLKPVFRPPRSWSRQRSLTIEHELSTLPKTE